jgi:glycine/D-amino acid oxidase-like deaminating enzyme
MDNPWWMSGRQPIALPPSVTREGVDVLVVGAGIVGVSAAIFLADRGHTVSVLEAHDEAGRGTTAASTGKLSLLQGTRFSALKRAGGMQEVGAYLDGARAGLDFLTSVAESEKVDLQRRTAATFAETSDQVDAARTEYETAKAVGLPVEWQERPDLGVPSFGAVTLADQIQVNPFDLLAGLVEHARRAGVEIVGGHRVQVVDHHDEHVDVECENGVRIRAAHVVIATGSPIVNRAMAFAAMTPSRTSMLALSEADEIGMLLSAGSPAHSVRDAPAAEGKRVLIIAGEPWTVGSQAGAAASIDKLRRWVGKNWHGLTEVAAWAAQDYMPAASSTIVGHIATQPRIHVATGFAKWGLLAGVAAARTIEQGVLGEPEPTVPTPTWLKPQAVGGLLALNAGVAAKLAKGWATRATEPDVDGAETRPVCTHLGGVLSWNAAEESWDCPLHGSRFTSDGEVIEGPATHCLKLPAATRRGTPQD